MARTKPTVLAAAPPAAQVIEQEVLPPEGTTPADIADASLQDAPPADIADAAALTGDADAELAEEAEPLDLAAILIPMSHPDGGTCDRYESDEDGNILVPALEVAEMMEHGFLSVDD